MKYKAQAQELGVKYLFGKWGFKLMPRDPFGRVYKLISFVPLDGWTSDPQAIVQAMFDDPDFEVEFERKSTYMKIVCPKCLKLQSNKLYCSECGGRIKE